MVDWKAGVLVDALVVDAQTLAERLLLRGDWHSVRSVIAHPSAELARAGDTFSAELGLQAKTLRLGPPIPDPDKVLCIGLNYRDHQEESMGQVSVAQKLPHEHIGKRFTRRPDG